MPLPLNGDNTPSLINELLYQLKVRDVMTTSLVTATAADSLRHIQRLMKDNNITGVPIAEGSRLVGIVSMDDIIRALDEARMEDLADQHMTRNVIVLEDDMPLAFGLGYMEKYHFGRFPVLDRTGALVGIITSRDILLHLLLAINKEMEALEEKLKPEAAELPSADQVSREFTVRRFDFEHAGIPSSEIKKLCKEARIDPKVIRRIAVASYELEMNQVIHSLGGTIVFCLEKDQARVTARDTGPGIPDIDSALAEGWSTATEWVRSLGFGAGMGLPNTRRVSDDFRISSNPAGTTVTCTFRLDPAAARE